MIRTAAPRTYAWGTYSYCQLESGLVPLEEATRAVENASLGTLSRLAECKHQFHQPRVFTELVHDLGQLLKLVDEEVRIFFGQLIEERNEIIPHERYRDRSP